MDTKRLAILVGVASLVVTVASGGLSWLISSATAKAASETQTAEISRRVTALEEGREKDRKAFEEAREKDRMVLDEIKTTVTRLAAFREEDVKKLDRALGLEGRVAAASFQGPRGER